MVGLFGVYMLRNLGDNLTLVEKRIFEGAENPYAPPRGTHLAAFYGPDWLALRIWFPFAFAS